jgi:hypothetical protein
MGEGRAGASQGLTGRGKRQSAEAIALRGADDVPESGERWNSRGCVGVVGPFPFCFGQYNQPGRQRRRSNQPDSASASADQHREKITLKKLQKVGC